MTAQLLAYNPNDVFTDYITDVATPFASWDDETLYDLTFDPYDNRELDRVFRDWISETTHETSLIARRQNFESFVELLDDPSEFNIREDRVFFEDLRYGDSVSDIVKRESPGGDIRKYINTTYGSTFAIDFSMFRSLAVQITGFEPMTMGSVEELITRNICEEEWDNPQYPPAGRILDWADLVNDEFGLECGGMGSLRFGADEIRGGFDGFVIYGADEEVKQWCDERWRAVDSWSDRDQLEYPFMYPDEYELYDCSDFNLDADSVIRMWWD